MTDNVTNIEMEYVLTSIRRLVSAEGVANRVTATVPDEDKLVLSSALRVVKDHSTEQDFADAQATTPLAHQDRRESLKALETNIAELEATVGGGSEFEPETDRDDEFADIAPAFFRSSLPGRARDIEPEMPIDALVEDDVTEISAVDDLVSKHVPLAIPLQLRREDQIVAQEISEVAKANEAEDDEEILLDEETLRQMVQTIEREEPHGALGEAITRNIRKLIRREIHAYFDVKDGI